MLRPVIRKGACLGEGRRPGCCSLLRPQVEPGVSWEESKFLLGLAKGRDLSTQQTLRV